MAVVVFILSHTTHQNSTFYFASKLQERGHAVIYAGPRIGTDGDNLESNSQMQGFHFEVVDLYSQGDHPQSQNSEGKVFEAFLNNLIEGDIFHDFTRKIKPNIILLDIHLPMLAIIFHSFKIPIIFASTELLTDFDPLVPPLDSPLVPPSREDSSSEVRHAWDKYFEKRRLKPVFIQFLEKLCEQYKFPFQDLYNGSRCIVPFGFNFPELIFWPREFDFPRARALPEDKVYLGDQVDMNRKERHIDLLDFQDKPLIYCSMGTRYNPGPNYRSSFLGRIVNAFCQMPQFHFIVGFSNLNVVELDLNEEFINIHFIQDAPQIQILQKADLMITHAGGNSLKECLRLGVPVLCYPTDNDQFGNAARAVYHKIGLAGDQQSDSIEDIKNKIMLILEDNRFKSRALEFQQICSANENGIFAAIRLIESLIK